jgi:hypothetical protein
MVIGELIFACNLSVRRGRSSRPETARGASSFVRRKKIDSFMEKFGWINYGI